MRWGIGLTLIGHIIKERVPVGERHSDYAEPTGNVVLDAYWPNLHQLSACIESVHGKV